jgi:ankyrin repeat protein
MNYFKSMLKKVILLPALLFLFSCATTYTAQQLQPLSEGQTIDMGAYSVKAPLGEGWGAEVSKGKGTVDFIRAKKRALGILGGGTVIKVFGNVIFPEGWHLSEEEAADDYRNKEEQDMIEKGVKTEVFKLEDVKKGITTIDGRKLYFMSYKTIPAQKYVAQEAVLYLYFPPDFKKTRVFFGFLISEFLEKFSSTKPDLTQIYPVINSFQIVDPLASLTGINGEFIRAAAAGNITVVNNLLVKGADVNAGSSPEGSALMLTSFYGHIEVVRFLIDKGADVNRKSGNTYDDTALIGSILGGETEIAKLLIEKGSALNAKNNLGNTALILAAFAGNTEIAKFLIEKGANTNLKNNMGISPLIASAQYGRIEIVRLLIEKGTDINAQQEDGWTALMNAIDKGHIEIAKFLMEKGANVNLKSKNGWTALHAAAFKGPNDIVKLLIEKGADVNGKDLRGQTPLKIAKGLKHEEMVRLLKEAGAKD